MKIMPKRQNKVFKDLVKKYALRNTRTKRLQFPATAPIIHGEMLFVSIDFPTCETVKIE
jgi:hypothetical protein